MHARATNTDETLKALAEEVLEAFEKIADAALGQLGIRHSGNGIESLAVVNQLTAQKAVQNLMEIREGREIDCRKLVKEPAIARIVVADDDDRRKTLYISRGGTVGGVPLAFCSYLSPMGQLASLSVGDYRKVRLPAGVKNFEVLEKATFAPRELSEGWDSRPAVIQTEQVRPTTIQSLRALLVEAGVDTSAIDELERMLTADDSKANIIEGLQRQVVTAMQLRMQPILDAFQDRIFRLPLDSRLAIMGAPGTGKTTTLIRRLRQKLDMNFLDEDERELVNAEKNSGLVHANSWLMFTPTDLLKQYVKEAFNKEDVPAPDDRIQTWDAYRRTLARQKFPILQSGSSSGLILKSDLKNLKTETLARQIDWFEAFDAYQKIVFVESVATEAARLEQSNDSGFLHIGRQIREASERLSEDPVGLLAEIVRLAETLHSRVKELRDEIDAALREPLARHVRADPDFLHELSAFLTNLDRDEDDEIEDEDEADEEGPNEGLRAVQRAFNRAVRAKAVSEASRRSIPKSGRPARTLEWMEVRGVKLPPLADVGVKVLIHRAITRISKAPTNYVERIPARYRQFRRAMVASGDWYASAVKPREVGALEVDIILLSMLRAAGRMMMASRLIQRLGDRAPAILGTAKDLHRNQILVDEATDFSPVQLACMAALANPWIDSFFASGDFNQRLTTWGSRSAEELRWIFPDIMIEPIDIAYRQSRRLTEFARLLVPATEGAADPQLPEDLDNDGVPPVYGAGLGDTAELSEWLARRIREVQNISGLLPSIAVLVNSAEAMNALASSLNDALEDQNIRAVPCPNGQAIGQQNDVRIFEVEHIKGLEFEAVFFVDVDKLAENEPELFSKYIYVGATRAATFLGLTTSGSSLPEAIGSVADRLEKAWNR